MSTAGAWVLTPFLNAALMYAARGWRVLPCWWPAHDGCACGDPGCADVGKHPLGPAVPHGLKNATTNFDTIRRWWTRWPPANVAIATGRGSGLVVLDVDPRNQGTESLARFEAEHGALPESVRVKTGGGGYHYPFAHPGDHPVRCRTALGGYPGLDLKGDGGYVVAPPSLHPSGTEYAWAPGLAPYQAALAPCPSSLIELVERKPNGAGKFPQKDDGEVFYEGERNDNLASLAGHLRRPGLVAEEIGAALQVANLRRCQPPLDDSEVDKIAHSIGRYPPGPEQPFRASRAYRAPLAASEWPAPLGRAALHGLAGEFVQRVEPQTEADPAALLIHFNVMFGNAAGRHRHLAVGSAMHRPNLFAAVVGDTAKARKGTAKEETLPHLAAVDPAWAKERVQSGLSSGEGLIWAVRDPIMKREPIRKSGRVIGYEDVEADPGIADKRLLVIEPEFAAVLRMIGRQGNVLSTMIRDAWDRGDLAVMTKNSPARVTGAHISIIGHITADELRAELTHTDAASGFGNRFLWICAKRSKLLPDGGQLVTADSSRFREALARALEFAQRPGEIKRDPEARERWHQIYAELAEPQPGLLGAITSRAEAQVVRLSLIYALLDCSETIQLPHLEAALAVWRYCEASAACIFGDALGDPVADEILAALRASPKGLTRNEIRDLFGRHRRSDDIGRALSRLERAALARCERQETGGRPAERWVAGGDCAKSAVSAKRSEPPP